MRIALITSEYSGLPGSGGIGSYFRHLAGCLVNAGHEIEVFTSGQPGQLAPEKGVTYHQLGTELSPWFAVHASDALAARHGEAPFDLLESAELKAEGLQATKAVRELACVIRVHSPSVMLNKYLDVPPSRWRKLTRPLRLARIALGAWRRGLPIPPLYLDTRPPFWFPTLEKEERDVASLADIVMVMNEESRLLVREYWGIRSDVVRQVANPYQFPPARVARAGGEAKSLVLGYTGRLEPRKGILELAQALKRVLPRHPDWNVVLVGRPVPSCLSGADVKAMAAEELRGFGSRVQFPGPLPPEEMASFLDGLDLCVFPSLWETFHYAVLEAMAAGKAIVATRTGAVAELLDNGRAGRLINPGNIGQLARALDELMGDAGLRRELGEAARQRAQTTYSEAATTSAILEVYCLALERRDQRMGYQRK
jgi:glycosyltransferase involved in cell wall biosynthesis